MRTKTRTKTVFDNCEPRPDVLKGELREEIFAARLKDVIEGQVSHYVQVNLRDLDRVGRLLASVIEAGANTVSGVDFTVEDPEALVEQARQQALKDAQDKAERMAEALGTALERPILVMEVGGGYPTLADRGVGGGGGDAAVEVAAPSVSPGAFSVSVSVQVVYKIP